MAAIDHGYFVGRHEARARGLAAPDGAAYPTSVLDAHPLPIAEGLVVAAEVNRGR